jgi:hypothetical protein
MSETYQAPIEAERRRPEGEFRPDVGIVLSDGVTWYLPKPRFVGKYLAPAGKRRGWPRSASPNSGRSTTSGPKN